MKLTRKFALALMAPATAVAFAPALALAADHSDIRQLQDTKISLTQAIAAAEKERGGRALDASIDDDSFRPNYEVSIVDKNNRLWDVQVDGVSGEVTGAREDLDD